MKHRPLSRDEVIATMKQVTADKHLVAGARTGLMLSILILYDMWDFDKSDIQLYLEQYDELFRSFNAGNEDPKLWVDNIRDELGIDLTERMRKMV